MRSTTARASTVLVVRRQREVLDRYSLTTAQRIELSAAVDRGVAAQHRGRRARLPRDTHLRAGARLVRRESDDTRRRALRAVGRGARRKRRRRDRRVSRRGRRDVLPRRRSRAAHSDLRAPRTISPGTARCTARPRRRSRPTRSAVRTSTSKAIAGALLAGGVIGDVVGYHVRPPDDGRGGARRLARRVAHGRRRRRVAGGVGDVAQESSRRVATALVIGAGAVGYPLGLRYARRTSYRVTAGDVGTLIVGELLGAVRRGDVHPREQRRRAGDRRAPDGGLRGGRHRRRPAARPPVRLRRRRGRGCSSSGPWPARSSASPCRCSPNPTIPRSSSARPPSAASSARSSRTT